MTRPGPGGPDRQGGGVRRRDRNGIRSGLDRSGTRSGLDRSGGEQVRGARAEARAWAPCEAEAPVAVPVAGVVAVVGVVVTVVIVCSRFLVRGVVPGRGGAVGQVVVGGSGGMWQAVLPKFRRAPELSTG
ncbi:hypothetical protein DUI70_3067 [Streptomyces albus]|nr:hypothetical protein DUI70_3067 [Streptomyces albus]